MPPERGASAGQRAALRAQLTGSIGPHSPLWRERLHELGRRPVDIRTLDDLARLPAMGERDVAPTGDPADMARLVLRTGETGFALTADGPVVRRALRQRLRDRDAYRRIVDSEVRATAYAWTGLGFRWPVAYTRADLDTLARSGARAWRLLGLGPDDALLSVAPAEPQPANLALDYAALATGTPALSAERIPEAVAESARLAPPTVVAVPAERPDLLAAAVAGAGTAGADRLRTVLAVGGVTAGQRIALAAVAPGATVLAWHVPSGDRLPWVECRPGGQAAGLHGDPEHHVVQLVDAGTAEPVAGPGEVVVTQLAMRGSALLRWRTGDLAAAVATAPCPGCGSTAARVTDLQPAGCVAPVGAGGTPLDLRAVAGALAGRADLADWRVVVGGRRRDDTPQVVVHIVAGAGVDADAGVVARSVVADVRSAAGRAPTQVVINPRGGLDGLSGARLADRILSRSG